MCRLSFSPRRIPLRTGRRRPAWARGIFCASHRIWSNSWSWERFLRKFWIHPQTERTMKTEPAKARSAQDALDTRTLLKTLIAFKDGDFSARLPVDRVGTAGKIADTLNEIFKLNERLASEFARIST